MLRTLPEEKKSKWKDYVNKVVHAYNCTPHASTGFSPFYLLYGRTPRLPVDLIIGRDTEGATNQRDFAKRWKSTTPQSAYDLARKQTANSNAKSKKYYDRRLNFTELHEGDRVLVRNLTPRGGPGKLRSYWEETVYVVVNRKGTGPVYEVKRENRDGNSRLLHRNLRFPCDYLEPTQQVQRPPTARRRPAMQRPQPETIQADSQSDPDSDSDSEDELFDVSNQPLQNREEGPEGDIPSEEPEGSMMATPQPEHHAHDTMETMVGNRYPGRTCTPPERYGYHHIQSVQVPPYQPMVYYPSFPIQHNHGSYQMQRYQMQYPGLPLFCRFWSAVFK